MDPEYRRRALAQLSKGSRTLAKRVSSKYKYLKHNPFAGGKFQSLNIPQSSSNKSSKNRLHRLGIDLEVDVESFGRHAQGTLITPVKWRYERGRSFDEKQGSGTFWGTSNALRLADISCSQCCGPRVYLSTYSFA